MKASEAFPSKYLKAGDLKDKNVQLIIDEVLMEQMPDGKRKPALTFRKTGKIMILNKVNAKTIATAYGDEMDNWSGKPVVLFPRMVDFQGEEVEAIRVRVPNSGIRAAVVPPLSAPVPEPEIHNELNPPPGNDMDDEIPF